MNLIPMILVKNYYNQLYELTFDVDSAAISKTYVCIGMCLCSPRISVCVCVCAVNTVANVGLVIALVAFFNQF
jgi:hypothetical protein